MESISRSGRFTIVKALQPFQSLFLQYRCTNGISTGPSLKPHYGASFNVAHFWMWLAMPRCRIFRDDTTRHKRRTRSYNLNILCLCQWTSRHKPPANYVPSSLCSEAIHSNAIRPTACTARTAYHAARSTTAVDSKVKPTAPPARVKFFLFHR